MSESVVDERSPPVNASRKPPAAPAPRSAPAPSERTDTPKFMYDRKGPWPQPNPQRPFGEAPSVLHIPFVERFWWTLRIGIRIFAEILMMIPIAAVQSFLNRVRSFVTDAEFDHLMTSSCYQKFLTPKLDPVDEAAFKPYLGEPGATYFKSDFSAIAGVKPYKGMYIAKTVTLIKEQNGKRSVVAVHINDLVVDPTHVNAWNLTKFFVLQGAAYSMLFTEHPNLHFPFDSINAISKSSVPIDHPVLKLLAPHLVYQLNLDREVLQSATTVITDWRPTIYAPFCANLSDGLLDFFSAGYSGVDGNSAYPKYSFRKRPKKVYGDYGVFLDAYYETILAFTRKVAATIPANDDYTTRWAVYIGQWIPEFPTPAELFTGDTLAEVLAGIVWDESLGHAVDHNAFSYDVTPEQKFLRIHLKPPTSLDMAPVNPSDVATWWDGLKLHIAHRVFFEPHTLTRLMDTRYGFSDPVLQRANEDFLRALRETEANLKVKKFIPLERVSASVQF